MPRHAPVVAACLLLPLLLLWPLPLVWGSSALAAPEYEAANHIWGLWAALRTGSPLVVRTDLLGWPDGVTVVLVDPANLPWYALGAVAGPDAGYNTVFYAGLALLGLAGAMLAGRVGGAPWLGAVAAMCSPLTVAAPGIGMTETAGVGWVGIQLALLLAFLERGGAGRAALAALALAAAWHAGPYNGLWAAGIDVAVVLGRSGSRSVALVRGATVAASSALLCIPLAWAVLVARPGGLPGSAERQGIPAVEELAEGWRGGLQASADLLDPWLPVPLTGGEPELPHSAYVGMVALVAAAVAVRGERRLWPWLVGSIAFSLVSLGPHLYAAGEVLRAGGRPLLGPAGVAMLALPPLGRLTHWYRAGAVATLLLAPLVARLGRPRAAGGPAWGAALAPLLVFDVLVLAPLRWPLPSAPLPDSRPYAVLEGEGALVEIPKDTAARPAAGRWRDRTALAQTLHGRPVGGTIMGLPISGEAEAANAILWSLIRGGRLRGSERQKLDRAGFRWLALYPEYRVISPDQRAHVVACLGPPLAETPEVVLFDLRGGSAGDCAP